MRHFLPTLIAFIACASLAMAQETVAVVDAEEYYSETIKFAHVDRETVILAMSEYANATENIKKVAGKYNKELRNMENEYTQKFNYYLANRKSMTPQICERREKELVAMQQGISDFTTVVQQEIKKAEQDIMAEVYNKANNMIQAIGREYAYTYIFDTSAKKQTLPLHSYIGKACTDITPLVMELLGITPPIVEEEIATTEP